MSFGAFSSAQVVQTPSSDFDIENILLKTIPKFIEFFKSADTNHEQKTLELFESLFATIGNSMSARLKSGELNSEKDLENYYIIETIRKSLFPWFAMIDTKPGYSTVNQVDEFIQSNNNLLSNMELTLSSRFRRGFTPQKTMNGIRILQAARSSLPEISKLIKNNAAKLGI